MATKLLSNHCNRHVRTHFRKFSPSRLCVLVSNRLEIDRTLHSTNNQRHFSSLTECLQLGVTSMHNIGLPWWSSIALTTVLARSCLFPLVWKQTLEMIPFSRAIPKVQYLVRLFRKQWQEVPMADGRHKKYLLTMLRQGTGAAMELEKCRPALVFGLPLLQFGMFVYFISSIRSLLVQGQLPGIDSGGMLWFANLAEVDRTLVLPISAVALTYANLELGFLRAKGNKTNSKNNGEGFADQLKDILQMYLIFSTPFVMQLPAGVFMYWIPSSLFGSCQVLLLRQNAVRSALGLPPLPVQK